MRIVPGWYIHQLEVRIWFWSSAAWPPSFLYLSFITSYSSSLWRTDTIVFSKSSKPQSKLRPPPAGLVDGPLTEGEGGDFKQHIAVFIGISESAVARGDPWGGERRRPEGAPKGESKQSLKLKKRRVTRSVLNIYFFSLSLKLSQNLITLLKPCTRCL